MEQNNQNIQTPQNNVQGTKKFKWTRWIIMGGLLIAAVGILLVIMLTGERIINPNRVDHFDFTTLSGHIAHEQLEDARNRPQLYDGKTVLIRGNYPVGAVIQGVLVHRLHVRCSSHPSEETYIELVYAGGDFPHIDDGVGVRAVEVRGTFVLENEGENQRFFILVSSITRII